MSFIQSLISCLPRRWRDNASRAATGATRTHIEPPDPSQSWRACDWCADLVSPDDRYVLPTGEVVHTGCRMKQLDEKTWLATRRAMIEELRPAYVALGKTKEAQDLIFRLYPEHGVTLADAFDVLRELDRRVATQQIHNLKRSAKARAAIQQARAELRSLLAGA